MMVNIRKNNKKHQIKNSSRDNSKSRKKLNGRRTIQRTPAARLIEKSLWHKDCTQFFWKQEFVFMSKHNLHGYEFECAYQLIE